MHNSFKKKTQYRCKNRKLGNIFPEVLKLQIVRQQFLFICLCLFVDYLFIYLFIQNNTEGKEQRG